jgi:hypothetical protein
MRVKKATTNKTFLAGVAALSVLAAAPTAHARSVTIACEGKVGWHPLSAYTAISKGGLENECVFVTGSKIGRKILKVCPQGSQCSIEADINNTSGENEIYRIISISRIGTPALDATAAREKTAHEKSRWAAIRPYMEKAKDCVVENLGEEVTKFTINDILLEGACSQEGKALRKEFLKKFSTSGTYLFWDNSFELVETITKLRSNP